MAIDGTSVDSLLLHGAGPQGGGDQRMGDARGAPAPQSERAAEYRPMSAPAGITGAGIKQQLSRRPEGDFYVTPERCTEALMAADPPPEGVVWEPACGDGAIARVLRRHGYAVTATDLHDRGHGEPGVDFLGQAGWSECSIVTNPPFNIADDFALHALRAPHTTFVAMFQRLAWLEGAKRHAKLWGPHPPTRIWIFSSRQTLWRGDDPDVKSTGGAIAFAWFVWDRRAPPGPSAIGWLQTKRPHGLFP